MFVEPASRGVLAWEKRPGRELLRLSLPLVVSLLSTSVMTVVDTLFVGRLGPIALAGVGLGGVTAFAIVSFGIALFSAARVEVSEDVGRGNAALVRRALGDFGRLAVGLGGASLTVGVLSALLLPSVSADGPSGVLARDYALIRAVGFPLVLYSAAIGQWRQARGDSASTMRAALAANIANAPLNWLLVFGLGLGVSGAALATVAAQGIELAWLVLAQRHEGFFWKEGRMVGALRAFRRGLPTGTERVLDMIAFALVPILLMQVGPVHVAAHQVTLHIMLMSFLPLIAFSDAVSILVAQAVGAGRLELVGKLFRRGLAFALGYALVAGTLALLLREPTIRVFNPDPELVEVGARTLAFGAVLQLINAAYNLEKGVLRGLSDFRFVAWCTVGCAWTFTPPLTYVLGVRAGLGAPGAWLALIIEVSVGVFVLSLRLAVRMRGFLRGPAR